jgi:hypothetical protein
MRQKKVKLITLVLLSLWLTGLHAQEGIIATGVNITGIGGSVCYSIGQVFYSTSTGTNGSVAQGVSQPFEISIVSGIDETLNISFQCSVYPNPASNFLTLKFENLKSANLSYQIYDLRGKLLALKQVVANETIIDMSDLSPATYFLRIIQDNKEMKVFKINKN